MIQETFAFDPVPPFRLDLTVWALRRRVSNQIDQWDGATYTRVLQLDGQPVSVSVSQQQARARPRLLVTASSLAPCAQLPERIGPIITRMLGCATDVTAFSALAERAPHLAALAERFQGLKPPRFPSLFEALLNAFACQQVSLDVGILLLNRLTEAYGQAIAGASGVQRAFPMPEALACAAPEHLRALGFSRQKARAILELAATLEKAPQELLSLETRSNEEIYQRLLLLRGVGRWSAEYVLLRGFGRIEVFPGDDVGAQKNLQILLALADKPTYEQIQALTARWQPYAGFVYFHLLLDKLAHKGFLSARST
jgi:DNA-3-methyladenine glycosylase II